MSQLSNDPWKTPGKTWAPSPVSHSTGMSQIFRTGILMAGLIALLVWMGNALAGEQGMLLFGAIGVVFNLGSWWFSDSIALAVHRAVPADPAQYPQLYSIVQELSATAQIPMPRVYIIPTMNPNAFATGRSPNHSAVAVTEGILRILNARELRGVLAHELSHVANRDTLISTIAASIAGLISSVASIIRWGEFFGGYERRDDRDGRSGLSMLAMAIVAPVVAMLVQFAISRSREFAADESGAKLSGDPNALADALERLEEGREQVPYEHAGMATAHLFIVNPFSGRRLMNLLSTHPPTEERIARLRQMAYQSA